MYLLTRHQVRAAHQRGSDWSISLEDRKRWWVMTSFYFFFLFPLSIPPFFFFFWMAETMAHGSSQARNWIWTTAARYTATAAMPDPLTHWGRLGIEPAAPQRPELLLGFLTHCRTAGTLPLALFFLITPVHYWLPTESFLYFSYFVSELSSITCLCL